MLSVVVRVCVVVFVLGFLLYIMKLGCGLRWVRRLGNLFRVFGVRCYLWVGMLGMRVGWLCLMRCRVCGMVYVSMGEGGKYWLSGGLEVFDFSFVYLGKVFEFVLFLLRVFFVCLFCLG